MIVNVDVTGLEVLCAAYLSQDPVLLEELRNRVDIHSSNQAALGLSDREDGRIIAKKFKFLILYGGTAYSLAINTDLCKVNSSVKYWDKVIEKYYAKYKGIADWHKVIIAKVAKNKLLVMPTGREYEYEFKKNYKGELELPLTTIKNYPVNLAA